MKDDPTVKVLPPEVAHTPPPPDTTAQLGLCKEDWLIIDEALHRVARSLRKIENEEKQKRLEAADGQLPANQ
jgi:hypothetical protein